MNIAPSRKAKLFLETKYQDTFNPSTFAFFARLASAAEVVVAEKFDENTVSADECVQVVTPSATVYLPLSDLVDYEKEKARLETERQKLIDEVVRFEKKLSNEGFVAKAPESVVAGEKAKLAAAREKLAGVEAALAKIK